MTVRKETGNDAKSKKILFKQNITFSLGVTRIEDLPKETSAEVAFFGRSNVSRISLYFLLWASFRLSEFH